LPANLPWDARRKLAEYSAARNTEEKIRALQEAMALIPKHKGTAKVLRFLRKRLSELRREAQEKKGRRPARLVEFYVERGALPQISLLGPANAGKSSLLNALTGAGARVEPYPFTTVTPQPGILQLESARVQLVELPSVLTEDLRESAFAPRSIGFAKGSDALLIVLDASRRPEIQFMKLTELLELYGLRLGRASCRVQLTRLGSGGLRVMLGPRIRASPSEVSELLVSLGYAHAVLRVEGEGGLEEIEDHLVRGLVYRPAVIALNKIDLAAPGATLSVGELGQGVVLCRTSAVTGSGLEELRGRLFGCLGLIRVYTRRGGVVEGPPLLLRRGATVRDVASAIHAKLAQALKFARLWGPSAKLQGQRVGPEHVLEDGDVVELVF